jgi:hypothetical protein
MKLKPEDVVGKTPIEAMEVVSQMKDKSVQARQILTIFLRELEKTQGLAFIEGIATMDLDINILQAWSNGAGIKVLQTSVHGQVKLLEMLSIYAQQLSPMIQIVRESPNLSGIQKATWFQSITASGNSFSMASKYSGHNPIGLLIVEYCGLNQNCCEIA